METLDAGEEQIYVPVDATLQVLNKMSDSEMCRFICRHWLSVVLRFSAALTKATKHFARVCLLNKSDRQRMLTISISNLSTSNRLCS